jgi:hypothetical protein
MEMAARFFSSYWRSAPVDYRAGADLQLSGLQPKRRIGFSRRFQPDRGGSNQWRAF